MPHRGAVLAAKALLVGAVLFVVGTVTALVGYFGGNFFLDREGIGMALEGDVLRAMYGSGLYLAGVGLFTVAVGFLLRHTAGTISIVLALMLVLGNMVNLVPGEVGEWLAKLMPGNAGSAISSPVSFNPDLLDAWTGFAVFAAEIAVLAARLVRRHPARRLIQIEPPGTERITLTRSSRRVGAATSDACDLVPDAAGPP